MKIEINVDSKQVALATANIIKEQLVKKPDSLLCMAAGHTQKETLNLLAEWYRKDEIDFNRCRIVSLDEWVGLPGNLPGTCFHFINSNILTPMNVSPDRYFFFDGCAADLDSQCVAANEFLDKFDGIDLILLGVGMNAHLGFNEPGTDEKFRSHVSDLDNTTKRVGVKYFDSTVSITQGITLGLNDILSAAMVVVQATGAQKSTIVRQICECDVSNLVPASLVRNHKNALMLLDQAAAALL